MTDPRPRTPVWHSPNGSTLLRVQRFCNGCGRELGDATVQELYFAKAGFTLPDVRGECGCVRCPGCGDSITARYLSYGVCHNCQGTTDDPAFTAPGPDRTVPS